MMCMIVFGIEYVVDTHSAGIIVSPIMDANSYYYQVLVIVDVAIFFYKLFTLILTVNKL